MLKQFGVEHRAAHALHSHSDLYRLSGMGLRELLRGHRNGRRAHHLCRCRKRHETAKDANGNDSSVSFHAITIRNAVHAQQVLRNLIWFKVH